MGANEIRVDSDRIFVEVFEIYNKIDSLKLDRLSTYSGGSAALCEFISVYNALSKAINAYHLLLAKDLNNISMAVSDQRVSDITAGKLFKEIL